MGPGNGAHDIGVGAAGVGGRVGLGRLLGEENVGDGYGGDGDPKNGGFHGVLVRKCEEDGESRMKSQQAHFIR